MVIDAVFILLLIFACIKGYQRGLIVGLFSTIAFIVGIAAAIKFSAVVASKLSSDINISAKWLPVISFLLIFLIALILVNLGAKLLQKSVEMIMLGWVNRIGGIIFYLLLFSILFSIFLFYGVQLRFIKTETIQASHCYTYLKPLGPGVIGKLGIIIPFFKDMFSQLEQFFGTVSNKI